MQFATDDEAFDGEEVKVTIGILQDSVVDANDFVVTIKFLSTDSTASTKDNEDTKVVKEEEDTTINNPSDEQSQETQSNSDSTREQPQIEDDDVSLLKALSETKVDNLPDKLGEIASRGIPILEIPPMKESQ